MVPARKREAAPQRLTYIKLKRRRRACLRCLRPAKAARPCPESYGDYGYNTRWDRTGLMVLVPSRLGEEHYGHVGLMLSRVGSKAPRKAGEKLPHQSGSVARLIDEAF